MKCFIISLWTLKGAYLAPVSKTSKTSNTSNTQPLPKTLTIHNE